MSLEVEERIRRNLQYKTFDKLLTNTHGGDYVGMYKWLMSDDFKKQFKEKWKHDQFISDFVNWSRNRGISFE